MPQSNGSKCSVILALAVIIMIIFGQVLLPSANADYNIQVTTATISVTISGDFAQGVASPYTNATGIFALLPIFHSTVEAANATLLSSALSKAIRDKTPSATISEVKLTVDSKSNNNNTLLHYDLTFNVQNTSRTNSICCERINLAWRAFVMTDDFRIGNISINKIVPTYIQKSIEANALATGSGPTGVQVQRRWFLNNDEVTPTKMPLLTRNLSLFNFTSLSNPLPTWDRQHDVSLSKITLSSAGGLNITFRTTFIELGESSFLQENAVSNVRVLIEAPLTATPDGDELIIQNSPLIPQLLTVGVLSGIIVFASTYVLESRIAKKTLRKRDKFKR